MLSLGSQHRFFLYAGVADMRKGFDGLSGLVAHAMGGDPLSGDVFLFVNRRRDRMKLLVWEQGGFVLWYKRLEAGTFELPQPGPGEQSVGISWRNLVLILEGVKLDSVVQRKRFPLPESTKKNA